MWWTVTSPQVCNCANLCEEVTREEDAKEDAFSVLPFTVESCEVHGTSSSLTCHATCKSTRPAKTVNKPWQCMSHVEVAQIRVPMSTLPRCEASCATCPDHKVHGSFARCDSSGVLPGMAWSAPMLAVIMALSMARDFFWLQVFSNTFKFLHFQLQQQRKLHEVRECALIGLKEIKRTLANIL